MQRDKKGRFKSGTYMGLHKKTLNAIERMEKRKKWLKMKSGVNKMRKQAAKTRKTNVLNTMRKSAKQRRNNGRKTIKSIRKATKIKKW